ncbi:MAG: adenosine kinase [Spirochaetes bacterium]|nr:adenosine kinase [Spirochaetota bacterium]MBN2770096.1 adenosine kinase [Spirochaetota bacterium]
MRSSKFKYDLIGVGSPIVDLLAKINENFLLNIGGGKGGMQLVDDSIMDKIITEIDKSTITVSPGGSAANTIFAASHLGLRTAFVGKLGRDENSRFYESEFRRAGGSRSRFKHTYHNSTARCLSLITPDAERTMRTNLAAASELDVSDINSHDFQECRHVHLEGYLMYNPELFIHILKTVKQSGCTISMDLGSYEVVNSSRLELTELISKYVDMVFANEDEAEALFGKNDHEKNLDSLGDLCETAAIKIGPDGSLIKSGKDFVLVKPEPASARIDTTGAGDLWASGFLYARLRGHDLATSGRAASYMGARAVEKTGTAFNSEEWQYIQKGIKDILSS